MPEGNEVSAATAALIDLTAIRPAVPPVSDGKGLPVAVGAPTPIDETRKKIAYALLGLLAAVILIQLAFGSVYSIGCWHGVVAQGQPDPCELASKSLNVMSASISPVFTAMIGLVGSVVGFYFGSKAS